MIDEVLDLDEQIFVFETVMRVRNTEVDIGQHLTLEALTALISETRVRFLYSKGIKEIDADYQGLIVDDLQLNIVSLVRAREELLFEMGVSLLTGDGGNITTKVTRMYDGSTIAIAQQHFVNYDYRFNKVTTINNSINQALNQQLLDI